MIISRISTSMLVGKRIKLIRSRVREYNGAEGKVLDWGVDIFGKDYIRGTWGDYRIYLDSETIEII